MEKARSILDAYLETNRHRKTPERYAILDAVYRQEGHFTLEQLGKSLEQGNFRVSRATLYNTMRLFLKARLVVRHRLDAGIRYEACHNSHRCHQICTFCGKVTEIDMPQVEKVLDATRLKRFRKESFTLYIYGICSTCQAQMTKNRKRRICKKQSIKSK